MLALLTTLLAWGADLDQGRACLQANDVPCAEAIADELGAATSSRATYLDFAAKVAFFAGRYQNAADLKERAVAAGVPDPYDERALYQRTVAATDGYREVERGRFLIRYQPGVDAILVDDAARALEQADLYISPLLGGSPPGSTILEIYPDGRTFIDASSLSREAVQTTGVVALSKWSRLLLTSPRALGRGYAWMDTVAHEYTHLVVTYHTGDRAPVWLQEAIARYLENRWRGEGDRFALSVRSQGLLAAALHADDFVTFEEMNPSFALLPSAERAELAYAQVSSLMSFCFHEAGDGVLLEVLPRVAAGDDAAQVLAEAAGRPDMDTLLADWRVWVSTLDLVERQLAAMHTVLDGEDVLLSDPHLAERADLQRYVRLGDLLRERERPAAALVEYEKALPEDHTETSPFLSVRMAQVLSELGDDERAEDELTRTLSDYPEHALAHKTLGQLYARQGRTDAAIAALREAASLNPFDPEVQGQLVELYRARGSESDADRHARYLTILRRGGED